MHIVVTISHPKHGTIARLESLHINRSQCGTFVTALDEESEELGRFASEICESDNGRIKDKYLHHPHNKGSGCWGEEFHKGAYIYISDIGAKGCWVRTFR